MKKDIVLGVIGLGEHMLRAHIPYLLEQGATVKMFFDPQVEINQLGELNPFQEGNYPKKAELVEEIYQDDSIDAILIGSPDQYHPEQLLNSVMAAKHVFVEKPLAIDLAGLGQVQKALKIAKDHDLVISTCHPRRFDLPVVELKAMIENSEIDIGSFLSFSFDFLYHKVTDEWKKDRSLMMDHFGHEIDLMRFLFNKRSTKVSLHAEKHFDSYAHYLVSGALDDIHFVFEGKRTLEGSEYKECLEIHGVEGFLHLNINDGLLFVHRVDGSVKEIQLSKKSYEAMFRPVNNNFIQSILGNEKPYVDHYDLYVNNASGIYLDEKGLFEY